VLGALSLGVDKHRKTTMVSIGIFLIQAFSGLVYAAIAISADLNPTVVTLVGLPLLGSDKWIGFTSTIETYIKTASGTIVIVFTQMSAIHVGYTFLETMQMASTGFASSRRALWSSRHAKILMIFESLYIGAFIVAAAVGGFIAEILLAIGLILIGLVLYILVLKRTARLLRLLANAHNIDKIATALKRMAYFVTAAIVIGCVMLASSISLCYAIARPTFHNAYDEANNWNAPMTWSQDVCYTTFAFLCLDIALFVTFDSIKNGYLHLKRVLTASQKSRQTGSSGTTPNNAIIDPTAVWNPTTGASEVGISAFKSAATSVQSSGQEFSVVVVDESSPELVATGNNWKGR